MKSFIDTVVWRLGDGLLAGATILLAAKWGRMGPVQVSWVNLVLLGCWMVAAWVAQRQYVQNLQDSIQNYRLDTQRATTTGLERSATELLSQQLNGDAEEVLYALRVLGAGRYHAMHPAVRGLLSHPSAEVRAEAIRVLDEAADTPAQAAVEKLLYDPDIYVRTQALLYVAHHTQIDPLDRIEELGNFQDFSIRAAMITFLAQPGRHENIEAARLLLERMLEDEVPATRLEAARLLEILPDRFEDQLGVVLDSKDPEQVRLAIRAVGHLRKRKFVAKVISRLGDQELTRDATEAVAAFGDRVVGALRDDLTDPDTPVDVRREIPNVLLKIGTQAALAALAESMLDADPQVRFRVISALNKLQDLHPSWPVDTRLIETILGAEIMGHLRSYQIIGTLDQALGDSTPIAGTLQEGMDKELERIFRLLKLMHPTQDLHSAYVGVQTKTTASSTTTRWSSSRTSSGRSSGRCWCRCSTATSRSGSAWGWPTGCSAPGSTARPRPSSRCSRPKTPGFVRAPRTRSGPSACRATRPSSARWLPIPDPLLRETALQAQARLREA